MDSLDIFYNYYSNNNKNDRFVYLIDLKIMLTPTFNSKDEFKVTLNEEDTQLSSGSMESIKRFFETELEFFEKLSKLATNFGQVDFEDLWGLFVTELPPGSPHAPESIEYLSLIR